MKKSEFNVSNKLNYFSDLCYEAELLLLEMNDNMKLKKRENFRRMVSIHLLALMLNTANSVLILLRNENSYAAAILVRAMVEQLVNLRYIYLSSTYENLVRYLYDGDASFIRNVKKAAKTMQEYNHEKVLDEFIEDALSSIHYRVSSSRGLLKYGYPLKSMPSFADRVKLITDHDDDLDLLFFYLYDYLTYSRNVHTSKDKIIEMTYAETYEDWFQAVGSDGTEGILRMINTAGDIVGLGFTFISKQMRVPANHKFHSLQKSQDYTTNIGTYRNSLT